MRNNVSVNVITLVRDIKNYDNCLWHSGKVATITVGGKREMDGDNLKRYDIFTNGFVDCLLIAKRDFTDSLGNVWRKGNLIASVNERNNSGDFYSLMSNYISDDNHLQAILSGYDNDLSLIINSGNTLIYFEPATKEFYQKNCLDCTLISEAIKQVVDNIKTSLQLDK